jgi:hypothetical protein
MPGPGASIERGAPGSPKAVAGGTSSMMCCSSEHVSSRMQHNSRPMEGGGFLRIPTTHYSAARVRLGARSATQRGPCSVIHAQTRGGVRRAGQGRAGHATLRYTRDSRSPLSHPSLSSTHPRSTTVLSLVVLFSSRHSISLLRYCRC